MSGKRLKTAKKALCLIFVLLLSINSFAAAVSDNDGSAFITKAEFDSLKNNFQAQINAYNTSIDAKIDEAIASYLSGLKISKKEILYDYIAKAFEKDPKNVTFSNWNATPSCAGRDEHDIESFVFVSYSNGPVGENPYSGKYYGWTILKNTDTWVRPSEPVKYPKKTPDTNERYHDYMYWGYFNDNKDMTKGWYLYDTYMHRAKFNVSSDAAPFDNIPFEPPKIFSGQITFESDFTTRKLAGKVAVDKQFAVSNTKTVPIPLWISHEWYYETLTISGTTSKSTGVSKEKEQEGTKQEWLTDMNGSLIGSKNVKMTLFEKRDEYPDDPAASFPDKTANPVSTIKIQQSDEQTGSSGGITGVNTAWWNGTSKLTNRTSNNNVIFNVKYRKQKKYTVNLNKLTSKYWSDVRDGESHYSYNGVLLAKNLKEKGEIELDLNVSLPNTKATCTYTYAISDRPFKNEIISQNDKETIGGKEYNHILKYETGKELGKLNLKIKKETILDKVSGDSLYIKISPDDSKMRIQLKSNSNPSYTIDK